MNKAKIFSNLSFFVLVCGVLLIACSNDTSKTLDEGSTDVEEDKEVNFYLQASKKPTAEMYIEELSEMSGYDLNFEFVPAEDYNEKLPVLFASGDLPDIIQTDGIKSSLHKGALESGVFLELGPLLEEYGENIMKNVPEGMWESPRISKDGKIYALPDPASTSSSLVTFIRKDWLDKLGMEVPETLDDWLEYFEAVKQNDMNENGNSDDEYGYYLRQNYNQLFFGAFGVNPDAWHIRDGEMIPDMITTEMKPAIEFYQELYSKGYINDDLFTIGVDDRGNNIKQGVAGSYTFLVEGFKTYGDPDNFSESDVEVILVPPPVGPNGESGLGLEEDGIFSTRVIPADTENAEKIIKFWDWAWSSEEAETFFNFGIKDHNYTVEDEEVSYDESAPVNAENFMSAFYSVTLNIRGDSRLNAEVLDHSPYGDVTEEGLKLIEEYSMQDESKHMPLLESFETNPELVPGLGDGTLFLEMFAKVITGEEELDPAFDEFVEKWKAHGGEEAIEEATEWYNDFNEQ